MFQMLIRVSRGKEIAEDYLLGVCIGLKLLALLGEEVSRHAAAIDRGLAASRRSKG